MNYTIPYNNDRYFYILTDYLDCMDCDWKVNSHNNHIIVKLSKDSEIRQYECEILMYLQIVACNEMKISERRLEMLGYD